MSEAMNLDRTEQAPTDGRPHPFFNSYLITPGGRVYSLSSKVFMRPNHMRDERGNKKYQILKLRRDGVSHDEFTHSLVLETFIGPRPHRSYEANHKDGDIYNNNIENLEWIPKKLNLKYRKPYKPAHSGAPKLTKEMASKIKSASAEVSLGELAKEYGVSKQAIRLIRRGITWKNA